VACQAVEPEVLYVCRHPARVHVLVAADTRVL
jgi:hypothetical protein